jgi:hypothetical protein
MIYKIFHYNNISCTGAGGRNGRWNAGRRPSCRTTWGSLTPRRENTRKSTRNPKTLGQAKKTKKQQRQPEAAQPQTRQRAATSAIRIAVRVRGTKLAPHTDRSSDQEPGRPTEAPTRFLVDRPESTARNPADRPEATARNCPPLRGV